ncbi:DUF4350 domain-containing protein [Cognatilysobacter segetis]|uniref:DUF4350 domain-containing protein n=1 Tax=Cognatilysobacter segetis TaxID=2492394 RepID=UPI00105E0C70|nr:DUF4350 domain-containing protein [Lysobacter segetis]
MKARGWLAAAVGALLVAGAVAWWLHTFKRVERWVDLPRTGEAARDPLFALRLAVQKDGRRARAWRRLDPAAMGLTPHDTLLFDGDVRTLPTPARTRLLDWVGAGGHLVVGVPEPDVAADAFDGVPRDGRMAVPLLDALGVRVPARRTDAGCVHGEATPMALCSGRRFEAPRGTAVRLGDVDGDVFARVHHGRGSVDVLGSLAFLTTDYLKAPVNRAFAHELLAAGDPRGTVHLVHAASMPSLWRTLLRRGWPVWLPLVLLLGGWLWARMRRFGPLLPSPALERRSLLEHVAASGQHQWRYGRGGVLYDAMRAAMFDRLRRRDPQAAALEGEPQLVRLVERLKLPAASMRDALRAPEPRDAKAFVARIATLVRMRNRL